MPLSDTQIQKVKPTDKAAKLIDDKGLFLLVHPNKSKYWRHKYRFAGKEQTSAYGVYPEVSLAEARHLRDEARASLRKGINPALTKRKQKIQRLVSVDYTFESIAKDWLKLNEKDWEPKHAKRVRMSLNANVFPKQR